MSTGGEVSFELAYDLAKEVSRRLTPLCSRVKCAGSVRRQRPRVGDLEFVVAPTMNGDLFGGATPIIDPIRAAMHEMGTWVKGGDRYMCVSDLLGHSHLKLDLFLVWPPSQWGSVLAIRTGPADLGKYVVTECQRYGYLHRKGHAEKDGVIVPTPEEEDFFALAGVECVPPKERDALTERLWAGYHRREVG